MIGLIDPIGRDQLELKRREENYIDAWIFFMLKEGHVLMTMRSNMTLKCP